MFVTQYLRTCYISVASARGTFRGSLLGARRREQTVCRRSGATKASSAEDGALKLSASCVEKLRRVSDGRVLRVAVEGGGCSGFQYRFQLEDKPAPDDVLFECDGARVVVDSASLDLLRGSTLDYHTELIRSAFRIVDNPQAERGCSCGASFTIKL